MPIRPSRILILEDVFLLTLDIKVDSTKLYLVDSGGFSDKKLSTFCRVQSEDLIKINIYLSISKANIIRVSPNNT